MNDLDREINRIKEIMLLHEGKSIISENAEARSQYNIVKIDSFKEAKQYGKYTTWCVAHYKDMYKSYTNDGERVFYFCLKNGFENEPEKKGQGCPLDSYGLSMIAVLINMDGSVNTITCRWDHDNGGNDNIMTPKELSKVIKMNFDDVFKPRTKKEIEKIRQEEVSEAVQYILENFDEIRHNCIQLKFTSRKGDKDKKDFSAVKLHNEWFIFNAEDIKKSHKLLIDMSFDDVYSRRYDMILVRKNDKYNFVSTKGKLLSTDSWFDDAYNFNDGLAKVNKEGEYNLINTKGQLLSPDLWFDDIDDFDNGYAKVSKEGKINFINIKGQLLYPDLWFDNIDDFNNGLAKVKKGREYNFINKDCQLVSPDLWFDGIDDFHDGKAMVKKDRKFNFINTKGQLKYPKWRG